MFSGWVARRRQPLRKDPPAVPNIVPDSEETGANELADIGRNTDLAQAIDD